MALLRTRLSPLMAVCLVGVLTVGCALVLPACGSDPFSGTWRSTDQYSAQPRDPTSPVYRAVLRIEKTDDGWTVTDGLRRSCFCREQDGRLVVVRGHSGPLQVDGVLERDGDRLRVIDGGTTLAEYLPE